MDSGTSYKRDLSRIFLMAFKKMCLYIHTIYI